MGIAFNCAYPFLKLKNMYKVEICYDEYSFKSKMPKLPKKGENVGFWLDNDWHIKEVDYIVYEFDKEGNYLKVEINLVY